MILQVEPKYAPGDTVQSSYMVGKVIEIRVNDYSEHIEYLVEYGDKSRRWECTYNLRRVSPKKCGWGRLCEI